VVLLQDGDEYLSESSPQITAPIHIEEEARGSERFLNLSEIVADFLRDVKSVVREDRETTQTSDHSNPTRYLKNSKSSRNV
jgi:hypothetical protein